MDFLQKLENFPSKFPNADKKDDYKALPGLLSLAVEMYNLYQSHTKGRPNVHIEMESDEKTHETRKLGESPPNWLMDLTAIYIAWRLYLNSNETH